MNFYYKCSECGEKYEITSDLMVCPTCSKKQNSNEPLRGILEVILDGKIENDFSIFDFLSVEQKYFPKIPVGNTPLWEVENLRKEFGFNNLFIKDDTCNPTDSLKDRASYLVSAFAKKMKIDEIVVASTGNAGSSMAGIGASANLDITIFMPNSAPKAKMIQSLQYGANVILVDGSYDKAFDLSLEYSKKYNLLSRNTAYNPLTIEGKKTVSLEIFNDLKSAPDFVFVPVGDGAIIGGVYKGFKDLFKFGFIKTIPKIIAVQSEKSDAICQAFGSGKFSPIEATTIADSISVGIPRNGYYVIQQLKKHDGKCITVSDDEILSAQKELSSKEGLFTEPAGATAFAGFVKMKNELSKDAKIVLLATGNGLKDIDSATGKIKFPEKAIKSIEEL
ncbi:MAG: threonine synthase [Candidatus Marinimicrobia bacterium]|nr:threonine synthase [Candidatus Neomarinimicrobiota bacterium]